MKKPANTGGTFIDKFLSNLTAIKKRRCAWTSGILPVAHRLWFEVLSPGVYNIGSLLGNLYTITPVTFGRRGTKQIAIL
jgi:hypothetical protein